MKYSFFFKWHSTLGRPPWKVNWIFWNFMTKWSKILWERSFTPIFATGLFYNLINDKLVNPQNANFNQKKIYIFRKKCLLSWANAKSSPKNPKLQIRIFPGISGSGFFPGKKNAQTCAQSNSRPFWPLCYQIALHQSFCLLEEAGVHEKCKKHTFMALITIFLKNVINKKCSQLNE